VLAALSHALRLFSVRQLSEVFRDEAFVSFGRILAGHVR
jgi:hypothetical protein